MAREATAETSPSVWRYWAARLTLQRAILQEQFSDLQGRRERAQKRAKAAEMIAQEANTARLKALLDAAREQATVRTIESAEQRFADARGDFEAAHDAFRPDEGGEAPQVGGTAGKNAPPRPWSAEFAGALRPNGRRRLSPGVVLAGIATLAAVGVASVFLLSGSESGTESAAGTAFEAHRAVPPSDVAAIAPLASAPAVPPQASVDAPLPSMPAGRTEAVTPEAIAPDAVSATPSETAATIGAAPPATPAASRDAEPDVVAKTVDDTGPASAAGTGPTLTALDIPPVPPEKPAWTMPEPPPAPRPNPYRFEAFEEPKPAPAPAGLQPFGLPE